MRVLEVSLLSAALAVPAGAAGQPSVEELLGKADDLWRGDSSQGQISMHIKTARWQRSLTMRVWSQGSEKTLIQVLAPAKEKGTATLKVNNEIWHYLPKVDRTIKVPASMMSGSWMGSHLTNDDLVKESRFSDDYDCEVIARPEGRRDGSHVVECVPHPDAPVVWGKVVLRFRASDELLDRITYHDEDGELVRTLEYSDVGDLGGRRLPRRVRVIPADEPDELTEVVYEELAFDVELPRRIFSLQALRR